MPIVTLNPVSCLPSRRRLLTDLLAIAALSALPLADRAALLGIHGGLVQAGPLDAFTNADAAGALRAALDKGSLSAIAKLGVQGGFLNNPQVRIPLPDSLNKLESTIRAFGRGDQLDELVNAMNRAAELAVPQAKDLLARAVKAMSIDDAKGILSGGGDSVTQFFRAKTTAPLTERFLPIVTATVSKIGLARRYNDLAAQGAKFGLVKEESATVERYVTGKSLDGLYHMIAVEEKSIRDNPLQAGASILKKVFGALR
jgi:Protein of unknown function (DUF4197)